MLAWMIALVAAAVVVVVVVVGLTLGQSLTRTTLLTKLTKKERMTTNTEPSYDGLIQAMNSSYKCRKKKKKELPIIDYFNHCNKKVNNKNGWLSQIIPEESVLFLLLLFFFYDKHHSKIILDAIRKKYNDMPGLKAFRSNLERIYIGTKNATKFKTKLIDAVVESYTSSNIGPIVMLLSEENTSQKYSGWFLTIGNSKNKRQMIHNCFIVTSLYSIAGGGTILKEHTDILTKVFGARSATKGAKKMAIQHCL